jgi:hypothetical protein
MPPTAYALSVKQPWAALLMHGLKTVEIRSWPTARRGRVWIHAAKAADPQPFGWSLVPSALQAAAAQTGGLIGVCELVDCLAYRTPEAFAADRQRHANDPTWFRPPVLYGFVLSQPTPMPFRACAGKVRFFPVAVEDEA